MKHDQVLNAILASACPKDTGEVNKTKPREWRLFEIELHCATWEIEATYVPLSGLGGSGHYFNILSIKKNDI